MRTIILAINILLSNALIGLAQKSNQSTVKGTTTQPTARKAKSELETPTITLLAKHKGKNIQLRWAPMNPTVWELGNQYGYIVERVTIKRGNKVLTKPENPLRIQLAPASQQEWEKMAQQEEYVKVAKSFLLDNKLNTSEKDTALLKASIRGKYAFSLLCADFSPKVAQVMRLSLKDTAVLENELYQYRVQVASPQDQLPVAQASLVAGLALRIPEYAPQKLVDLDFADSTTTLRWAYSKDGYFSTYYIERSDDNGVSYQKVNQTPFLPMENASNAEVIVYATKVSVLHKNYYYRVRGIDPFGELTPPSNTVKVYAYQTRLMGGQNLRSSFPNKDYVAINWDFPDSLSGNIKGFNVYKTKDFQTVKKVNTKLLDYATFFMLDKVSSYDENLYYIVSSVDLRGKEAQSEPLLVAIIDSIPPQKVTNLHGKIDKKGIVRIGWKTAGEPDIYGYNIFRAEGNSPNRMFMVKFVKGRDTTLIDTISLVAASRKVHYLVIPIDYHANGTKLNDTLTLIRPDVIAPYPPQINYLSITDTSVVIKWNPSTSEDVVSYQLYRRMLPDTTKQWIKNVDAASKKLVYVNDDVQENVPIQYVVVAVDQEGLRSTDSCYLDVTVPTPLKLKPVDQLTLKYIPKDKKVQLTWDYKINRRTVAKFLIFRKVQEGSLTKYKVVGGDEQSFLDDTPQEGTYTYSIMAISNDNLKSFRGKEVSVKVK